MSAQDDPSVTPTMSPRRFILLQPSANATNLPEKGTASTSSAPETSSEVALPSSEPTATGTDAITSAASGEKDISFSEKVGLKITENDSSNDSDDEKKKGAGDVKLDLSYRAGDEAVAARDETRQEIYMPDEDLQLHASFWAVPLWRLVLWYAFGFLTAGILLLIGYWFPTLRLRLVGKPARLNSSGSIWVCIRTEHSFDLVRVRSTGLPTEVPYEELFPPSLQVPFETPFKAAENIRPTLEEIKKEQPSKIGSFQSITHRYTTFIVSPLHGKLLPISTWRDAEHWRSITSASQGLSPSILAPRKAFFGRNLQQVKGKSVIKLLLQETLSPFTVFTCMAIALWSYDTYQWYALVIGVVTLLGIVASTTTAKRANNRMEQMSNFTCQVTVFRQGSGWQSADSGDLIPGDVVDVGDALETLPCDLTLLQGGVIVNESMLTGEAMPVAKTPVSNAELQQVLATGEDLGLINKHVLYSGTKIVRVSKPLADGQQEQQRTTAVVIRTGFNTARGSLIRAMMFPKPIRFKWAQDCAYFILFLVVIAILGFIGSLVGFIQSGVDPVEIAVRALDLFTICVPPAIPAAQAAVITFALARLRKQDILCTSPQRINVAGRVNMALFDKTGTLTFTDLDVLGTRECLQDQHELTGIQRNASDMETVKQVHLAEALATAHDLSEMDGALIGEPLEVKMFEFSGCSIDAAEAGLDVEEPSGSAPAAARTADGVLATATVISGPSGRRALIRKFDFVSALRRMSVIVRREGSSDSFVYCKGAPEQVEAVCDSQTLPSDLNAVLGHYTHAGYRVLALAGKKIEGLDWTASQKLPRSNAESGLSFLGLLIFENKLKDQTAAAITKLSEALIPTKMVTGDSALTAIAVAKEAGIVRADKPVFVARLSHDGIEWVDAQNEDSPVLDPYSLIPPAGLKLSEIGLAMTGETFKYMLQHAAKETADRALVKTQIFARMSPEQKQELVEQLQALSYTVSMCGDGANDCGALKAADVGLSLSEAESSVAAPFTSKADDISCIDGLMREGRSCLQTSCVSVLFLSIYAIGEYFSEILLYTRFTSFTNAEFLYIDVFIVLAIMLGLAASRPADRLAKWAPASRLVSRRLIVTLLGHIGLLMLAQAVVFVLLPLRSEYEVPDFDPEDLALVDMDNSAIFRISLFPYLIPTICFTVGPPHRQIIYKNWFLFLALVVLMIFNLYFLFCTGGPLWDLFGFTELPPSFQWTIFGVAAVYTLITVVFHFVLLEWIVKLLGPLVRSIRRWRGKPEQKPYARISDAIRAA